MSQTTSPLAILPDGTIPHWEYQGRDDHGRFGTGTAPHEPAGGAKRLVEVIIGMVGATPPGPERSGIERMLASGGLAHLTQALPEWASSTQTDPIAFADRYFGPATSAESAAALRVAASHAVAARTPDDQRKAAETLRTALKAARLDQSAKAVADATRRSGPPPYIATDPSSFLGKPSVGDGECVALVKQAANPMPATPAWVKGEQVMGSTSLPAGTIVATFNSNGKYSGHTAIYMGQTDRGMTIIDQWNIGYRVDGSPEDQHKPAERTLPWTSTKATPVNVGASYHVVR